MLGKSLLLASDASPYPGFVKCLLIAGKYSYRVGTNTRRRYGFYDGEAGSLEPKLATKLCVRTSNDGGYALLSDKQFYFEGRLYPATNADTAGDWDAFGDAVLSSYASEEPLVVYIKAD